jgi:hypothetical protein
MEPVALESTSVDSTETTADDDVDLMSLAQAADSGKPIEVKPKGDAPTSTEKSGTPAEKGNDDKKKTPDAEKGKDKTDGKPDPTTEKPESAYTKAQKEKARLDESWKKLNAEKEALRNNPEFKEFSEWKRSKTLGKADKSAKAPAAQYSAEEYDAFAKQYEEEGNEKMAKVARERAEEVRQQAKAQPANAGVEAHKTPEFQAEWQKNFEEVAANEPELQKDGSPLEQAVYNLVNDPTWGAFFLAKPSGIRAAVEVAKMVRQAGMVKGLQEEKTKLETDLKASKAEVDRLTKLTALGGSLPPMASSGTKTGADISDDDLRRMAEAADKGS